MAQAIVSTGESFVSARMLPGERTGPGERLAGLRLSLKPGWKTYWRSPGEAGVPPDFDWSGSLNVKSVEVLWPRPEVFISFGMQTIGYSDEVVLPLRVIAENPDEPMLLKAEVDLGVCKDICILERISLAERIAPGAPDIGAAQIRRALARVPPLGSAAGLTRSECRLSGTGTTRTLTVDLAFDRPLAAPVVLLEAPGDYWISDAETVARPEAIETTASLTMTGAGWFDRSKLRMTVLADGFAADVQGCQAPGSGG